MITAGIILIVISIFICIVIYAISKDNESFGVFPGFISGILCIFGLTLIVKSTEEPRPTAIDVYRNNTTLQITYQDSVPIDTVVVFKEIKK